MKIVRLKRFFIGMAIMGTVLKCIYVYDRKTLQKDFSIKLNTDYYICPSFKGGLGNQMFQFASSYGIARSKSMKILISPNCDLLKTFQLNVSIAKSPFSICPASFKTIKEKFNAVYDRRLVTFNVSNNVSLINYLQSFRYFDSYADEVRNEFTFSYNILQAATSVLNNNLKTLNISCDRQIHYSQNIRKRSKMSAICYNKFNEKVTLVGAHVRRGDWLIHPHPKLGFKTASAEYLQKAVRWYIEKYNNVIFIVASNGMQWTKSNFPKNKPVMFLSDKNNASTDLAILSLCNHFLSTVGTFSWWAGWLIGGSVTYFKWPASENSKYRPTFGKNFSDHFYPEWIGL